MNRRDFLKLTGVAGALAAAGCAGEPERFLVPYLNPPQDIIPGKATWYASTCRQCPAGCGIIARNREARVVKLEGNPLHPVNLGRLCARGQAGLQDLYNPDRLPFPSAREGRSWRSLTWAEALHRFGAEAEKARGRVAVLSGLERGFSADLIAGWLARQHSREPLFYEPLALDGLREGSRISFGISAVPSYDLSGADFILSLGADFLETWISPVEFARQFAEARTPAGNQARFIYAGPRRSLTAAGADRWLPLPPGSEPLFAYALLAALVERGLPETLPAAERERIAALVSGLNASELAGRAGVEPGEVRALAGRILSARSALVLADGQADTVVAAHLLSLVGGSFSSCIDFSRPHALSAAASAAELNGWLRHLAAGEIHMLVIHRSNPVYSLPGFAEAVAGVPLVAVLDSCQSETTAAAHLLLPVPTSYESWDSYLPREGLLGLLQPTMGPVRDTRPLARILSAAPAEPATAQPDQPFQAALASALGQTDLDPARLLSLASRGFAEIPAAPTGRLPTLNLRGYDYRPPADRPLELTLLGYPSLRWFDGRDANKPWLLEVPDPLTNITWDTWLEVHPDTAANHGLAEEDEVEVATGSGSARFTLHIVEGTHPAALAAPLGLGHARFGRFASGVGANPLSLTGPGRAAAVASLRATGRRVRFARVDGSASQHGRGLAQAVHEEARNPAAGGATDRGHQGGAHAHEHPLRLPIESAHDPRLDIYPAHSHDSYRWGMVVDLDRCTGCAACAVACYAENNVAVVGRELVRKRREMAWLRIERYFEPGENPGVRFLPMLCQHCDDAPCEPVCPVYAPTHDREGLNLQVYNRCVGTRFCMQNDPYKVRRFNFFHYRWDDPLQLQLNPDVTVRTKGVMEKCSFCVQRIKDAHQTARLEGRLIRDQEVVPACVQTCPTRALTFGSYLDPESELNRLVKDRRAYQVLAELGTKPAIVYLKKIIREDGLSSEEPGKA